jgi:hypothetical protein
VEAVNKNFMDLQSVKECITSLKIKNKEGFDRIPQRVLVDGIDYLLAPITALMNQIFEQKICATTMACRKNCTDIQKQRSK